MNNDDFTINPVEFSQKINRTITVIKNINRQGGIAMQLMMAGVKQVPGTCFK